MLIPWGKIRLEIFAKLVKSTGKWPFVEGWVPELGTFLTYSGLVRHLAHYKPG